jgi:hypothetical protein
MRDFFWLQMLYACTRKKPSFWLDVAHADGRKLTTGSQNQAFGEIKSALKFARKTPSAGAQRRSECEAALAISFRLDEAARRAAATAHMLTTQESFLDFVRILLGDPRRSALATKPTAAPKIGRIDFPLTDAKHARGRVASDQFNDDWSGQCQAHIARRRAIPAVARPSPPAGHAARNSARRIL